MPKSVQSQPEAQDSQQFTNQELVVIAAYLVGAQKEKTDTEDIAVKVNEIAPGRFAWKKYPQQINIDTVRKRLWDARKSENSAYLLGSEREGWMLTAEGLKFAKRSVRRLQAQPKRSRLTLKDRAWLRTERKRLKQSQAFQKFSSGESSGITIRDANDFFRIDEYVAPNLRATKVERYLNGFSGDRELAPIVQHLASLVTGRVR